MDSTAKRNFKDISRQLASVSFTIIIICFGYPLGFLVLVGVFIYRHAIQKLVKGLDPNFGDVLTGMNAAMSAHPPNITPRSVLVSQFYLASSLDKNVFIKTFIEKIVELKSSSGNRVYAELRQKIVPKFGYNFWYNVDSFNIHDHIKFLDESCPERVVTQSELIEITRQLSKRPFDESRSPWEIFLIPNLQLEKEPTVKSVMIMRFHHCLVDGFCITKILERLGEKPWNIQQVKKEDKVKKVDFFSGKIIPTLHLVIFGPYEILKAFYFTGEENSWPRKLVKSPQYKISTQQTDTIPFSALRTIVARGKGKFTTSSVLTTIFAQAVARVMKKQGLIEGDVAKFDISMPWPIPNHPAEDENSTGLTNHWNCVQFLAIVDLNDVSQTAYNIGKEYQRLSKSVLPQAFASLVKVLGSLPISFLEKWDGGITGTCLLSNFVAPFHAVDICGVELKEWVQGGSASLYALSSLALIYNGRLRYFLVADESIVNQEDIDDLAIFYQQIVMELQHATKRDNLAAVQTRPK